MVGTKTITFLLCRLPSYRSGSEPRDNIIRVAVSDPVRVCGCNAIDKVLRRQITKRTLFFVEYTVGTALKRKSVSDRSFKHA